jgi:hypothetical protein
MFSVYSTLIAVILTDVAILIKYRSNKQTSKQNNEKTMEHSKQ